MTLLLLKNRLEFSQKFDGNHVLSDNAINNLNQKFKVIGSVVDLKSPRILSLECVAMFQNFPKSPLVMDLNS